jgi:rhodanese-related sulfurtransferase
MEGGRMASPTEITVLQLARRIGLPDTPTLIDVCIDDDFNADARFIPGAHRRDFRTVQTWAQDYVGKSVVVYCHKGLKLSQGAAAWLRHYGVDAQSLEGGVVAWRDAKMPMTKAAEMPPRDTNGRTVWVTRARPKVDRIACPWLIRRFVDPRAAFLFVIPSEVSAVAERFNATPFDIDGVRWSHEGELCTFDVMIEAFGLAHPPLLHLARIVRAADTARLDLAPEAPGLLAASLGLSRMYKDDLAQLDAGMALYDAFYRWCRDATDETHNWPSTKPQVGAV